MDANPYAGSHRHAHAYAHPDSHCNAYAYDHPFTNAYANSNVTPGGCNRAALQLDLDS